MTNRKRLMLALGAILTGTCPALAETPASMCGSKPDMVEVMLRMVDDGVEKVYGDNRMFVKRDSRDGSLWVIALPNTTAHPAVFCRSKDSVTALLCPAGGKACDSFKEQATGRLAKVDGGTP